MCLYSKQIMPIRAKKRIEVYKIVLSVNNLEYDFFTLYRSAVGNKHKVFKAKGEKEVFKGPFCRTSIAGGYIHCYTNKKRIILNNRNNIKILRCYIEPGTLYWKSFDGEEVCAEEVYIDDFID